MARCIIISLLLSMLVGCVCVGDVYIVIDKEIATEVELTPIK